jgi:hypothetical protein
VKLNSILKHTSLFVVAAIAITSVFFINGCSKLNETVASENIQLPTEVSRNLKNLLSYLEVIEMVNSTKSSIGLKRENFDSLEQLINCKLVILDSLTTDGDGFQYQVVFPVKTDKFNPSIKNYDNNYRFGSFIVNLNFNYREINAISTIKIDSASGCYIGNGNGELMEIIGDFNFERVNTNKIKLAFNNCRCFANGKFPMKIDGQFLVTWIEGENTDGIVNDLMGYNGYATGEYLNESFNFNTSLALEKNQEFGCASNIIKGVLQIQSLASNKVFQVDFDPFDNKSCDPIVKIYILGKEYEITL